MSYSDLYICLVVSLIERAVNHFVIAQQPQATQATYTKAVQVAELGLLVISLFPAFTWLFPFTLGFIPSSEAYWNQESAFYPMSLLALVLLSRPVATFLFAEIEAIHRTGNVDELLRRIKVPSANAASFWAGVVRTALTLFLFSRHLLLLAAVSIGVSGIDLLIELARPNAPFLQQLRRPQQTMALSGLRLWLYLQAGRIVGGLFWLVILAHVAAEALALKEALMDPPPKQTPLERVEKAVKQAKEDVKKTVADISH